MKAFQKRAVAEVLAFAEEFRAEGKGGTVGLISPTGSGKTSVTGVQLVREFTAGGLRLGWMAPGPSLVQTAAGAMLRGGITDIGVIASGFSRSNHLARCLVSSVWTLDARRMWPELDVIVWDEFHRMSAQTFQQGRKRYPLAIHVGLTATLYSGNVSLANECDRIVVAAGYSELERSKAIAPCEVYCPPRSSLPRMVEQYGAKGGCLVFCQTQERARELAKVVVDAGKTAATIFGNTDHVTRRELFADMDAGRLDYILGCDAFTDGVNVSSASTVVFDGKVSSRRKAFQAIGRARRFLPGKIARVIDPEQSMLLHGLPNDAAEDKPKETSPVVCQKCFRLFRKKHACKGEPSSV